MSSRPFLAGLCASLCLIFGSQVHAVSLSVANADFNTIPVGGWGDGRAAPEWDNRSANNNEGSSEYNHSGSGGSLKIWAGAGIYVAHQDSSVENNGAIPAGASLFRLSYWVYTPSADPYIGTGNLHVEWLAAGWGSEFAPRSVFNWPSPSPDTWTYVDTGWQSIPSGGPNWRFVWEQQSSTSGTIFFDDFQAEYNSIPEPSTVVLLACATAGLLVARRRSLRKNVR